MNKNEMVDTLKGMLPKSIKDTIYVRLFGLLKVPLIFYVAPKIVQMDDEACEVVIPLNRRTKNHLHSMYFGVLCTGADIAGGLVAMSEIEKSGKKIALSFKDFHADFLKRAHGDVHFKCTQSREIKKFVDDVISSRERKNFPVIIEATVPSKPEDGVVAKFVLTLSLKLKD
jgi:acyl-coenzyme A thioesterase PaaI-like protein